jgi:hypothetical protein
MVFSPHPPEADRHARRRITLGVGSSFPVLEVRQNVCGWKLGSSLTLSKIPVLTGERKS